MTSLEGLVSEEEKYNLLIPTLLSETQYYSIAGTGKGDDKLTYLASNAAVINFLLTNRFLGSHVYLILVGVGWKDKLDWIVANYEEVLKPKGFTPFHCARIVKNKGWGNKIAWINDHYDPKKYSPERIAQIMLKEDWASILQYAGA